MEAIHKFLVEAEDEGNRIDKYISSQFPDFSRSYIQKIIKDEKVFVNDKIVKASYKVTEGDDIYLEIPKLSVPDILPENIPLDILFEDNDVIIVNKPKGMVVHPSAGHYTGTLVNALLYHCKDNLSGINGVMRPGIVHRIDMDTTGALIVCKNNNAHNFIAEQLKIHSITRKYEGIVHGNVKEDSGKIDGPIGRHPNNRLKMAINYQNGKEALTNYKVLERFDGYTYMQFQLETGRTHQIRVHLSSINHPLLGDTVYGPSKSAIKHLQGQTLHAKTIGFIHPGSKEYVEFSAPLPDYFNELLKHKL